MGSESALSIESIVVSSNRVVSLVRVSPSVSPRTSFALMERVLESYPGLARHACVNDRGPTFASVMNSTSLPHLLEHLVVELQGRAALEDLQSSGARRALPDDFVFVGTTEWVDRPAGLARVSVNFADDLVALRAFSEAVCTINQIMIG